MKPKISVIYSLARSGATLMSRCMGCADNNVILSEINPRFSWFNPLVQAYEWYGLFTEQEMIQLKSARELRYIDAIMLISEKCRNNKLNLIVRDWTHIDFTPGDYPVAPIYQMAQDLVLRDHFEISEIAITRHPLDTYLSVCKVPRMIDTLSLDDYMAGFLKFAKIAKRIGFVRYEDFCETPQSTLKKVCEKLGTGYAGDFENRYPSNTRVTGEVYSAKDTETVTGETIGTRSRHAIRLPPRRKVQASIEQNLAACQAYPKILEVLGYNG